MDIDEGELSDHLRRVRERGTYAPAATEERTWPTEAERETVVGPRAWTAKYERPTALTWPYGDLAERQAEWDAAEQQRLAHEEAGQRLAEARETRQREAREAAAARLAADQAAAASRREEELRAAFPGTDAEWEAEKGRILADDRARRTADGATAPRSLLSKREAGFG